MPASNIVNLNAQFLLGIEEVVRTTSILKNYPITLLESIPKILLD